MPQKCRAGSCELDLWEEGGPEMEFDHLTND